MIESQKDSKQSLKNASQELIATMGELSGALLAEFEKTANLEEMTENMEILNELE